MQSIDNPDEKVIDLIYAAMFGTAPWEEFLAQVNKNLPGGMSTLFYHDIARGVGAFEVTNNIPPEWGEPYSAHYSKINPWMSGAARRPVGTGVVAEQMLPRDQFIKTEFYNDFWLCRKVFGSLAT